jgi:uncharacterized protein (DUF302 family)
MQFRPTKTTLLAASLIAVSFLSGCASPSMEKPATAAADGMITLPSPRSPAETMSRLEATVKERGFAVIAKVDHAAGATRVNKTLRPTELLIFGNPQGGTPLMECAQTAGIDLPLKALVWQDAAGKVMLSYNDPKYLGARHKADSCPVIGNMTNALDGLMKSVVAP